MLQFTVPTAQISNDDVEFRRSLKGSPVDVLDVAFFRRGWLQNQLHDAPRIVLAEKTIDSGAVVQQDGRRSKQSKGEWRLTSVHAFFGACPYSRQ